MIEKTVSAEVSSATTKHRLVESAVVVFLVEQCWHVRLQQYVPKRPEKTTSRNSIGREQKEHFALRCIDPLRIVWRLDELA